MNHLLPYFTLNCDLNDKKKPAGCVPPDALLFVQAATKSKQKAPVSLRRASPLPGFRDVKTLL